jgi:hypothetical protein
MQFTVGARIALVGLMEVRAPKKSKLLFDAKKFLAKVGDGKTICEYEKD